MLSFCTLLLLLLATPLLARPDILPLGSIDSIFSFGDSLTSNNDNYSTSGSLTWIEYLYNSLLPEHGNSQNKLHNYARSGAAVNRLITPGSAQDDFVSQVTAFAEGFKNQTVGVNSLFTVFFGVNVGPIRHPDHAATILILSRQTIGHRGR